MGLKPDELFSVYTVCEIVDMYEAKVTTSNEEMDAELQRTAWFTSLLMNATGNFKKEIKPNQLYTSIEDQGKDTVKASKEYVADQKEQLKKKFNI
ncbi:hypothetical protein [Halobacillus karajensis]|uniref:hypothetical protein n=1 Tax=Halobacillus karajensis TaxID=195088 RepID=UPI00045C5F06|nr:hypothetical protein [Halobacillus karajensis]CDQ21708.1 hypothetical protein BN982_04117 [Halobacillus karajensis]